MQQALCHGFGRLLLRGRILRKIGRGLNRAVHRAVHRLTRATLRPGFGCLAFLPSDGCWLLGLLWLLGFPLRASA